jgi:hypothetical protein
MCVAQCAPLYEEKRAFFEVTVWRFSSMIRKGRSRTCKAMKPFLERLAGGRCSFRDLGMGETAALSHSTLLMALSKIEGPVEGNAEGARLSRKQAAEKTSPGALERKEGFHGLAGQNNSQLMQTIKYSPW